MMKTEGNEDIVLNEFNEIDVDYYIAKAYRLRNEAVREETGKLTRWIKKSFATAIATVLAPKTA